MSPTQTALRFIAGRPLSDCIAAGRDNILTLRLLAALLVVLGHSYILAPDASLTDPLNRLLPRAASLGCGGHRRASRRDEVGNRDRGVAAATGLADRAHEARPDDDPVRDPADCGRLLGRRRTRLLPVASAARSSACR